MKKAVFLPVLFAVLAITVFTGANAQQGIYFGVQGAKQLSVMFNKDDVDNPQKDYKAKFSGTAGISGGYNFNNHMGVGTELMYSSAKQRYIDHNSGYTQKFSYLKIPLLFTYNTNPNSRLIFTAKAGPQLGILLNSKITNADNQALNGTVTNQYRKITYGAMAGAGLRMHVTNNIFLDAGVRFDGTISNTENKKYSGYEAGRAKTHDLNAGLEIGMKYIFN